MLALHFFLVVFLKFKEVVFTEKVALVEVCWGLVDFCDEPHAFPDLRNGVEFEQKLGGFLDKKIGEYEADEAGEEAEPEKNDFPVLEEGEQHHD